MERSFADAKQLHGHRYAGLRGLSKVKEQCLLAAAAQNMKKIAQILARLLWLEFLGAQWLQSQIRILALELGTLRILAFGWKIQPERMAG